MMSLRTASLLALMGGFAGTGCMVEGDEGDVEDLPTDEVEQALAACPPMMCNGAFLNEGFHELSETGLENAEGFTLLGLYSGGLQYKVDVVGGQLKATRPGFATISGMGVLNKVLKVKHKDGTLFNITIDHVHSAVPYWPNVVGGGTTWAYRMTFKVHGENPDNPGRPICQNAADVVGEHDTLNQPKWSVVLFEGDRWDAKTKQPKPFSKEWFNVGCAGNVLGKLHMTHHSFPGSLIAGYANDVRERMAMINMYIANYCGDGTPFTVTGTELSWSDNHVWSPHYYPLVTLDLEARWDEFGAVCLETPRLKGTADPEAIAAFGPDIEAAIEAHCPGRRPKTCSSLGQSMDVTKLEGAYFVSANP
jgi:hypothetical protein